MEELTSLGGWSRRNKRLFGSYLAGARERSEWKGSVKRSVSPRAIKRDSFDRLSRPNNWKRSRVPWKWNEILVPPLNYDEKYARDRLFVQLGEQEQATQQLRSFVVFDKHWRVVPKVLTKLYLRHLSRSEIRVQFIVTSEYFMPHKRTHNPRSSTRLSRKEKCAFSQDISPFSMPTPCHKCQGNWGDSVADELMKFFFFLVTWIRFYRILFVALINLHVILLISYSNELYRN